MNSPARQFGEVILKLENISLAFGGVKALTDISFDVREHEIRAIIGPNGAGKSSMLNVINGVYQPQQGRITYRGETRHHMEPHFAAANGISRTFQSLALFKGMSVLDNLLAGRNLMIRTNILLQALRVGPALREEVHHRRRVEEIIDFLEIQHVRKTPVGRLPYGLQKRVDLGRALAAEPKVLLLDEPTEGIQPSIVDQIEDIIIGFKQSRRFAIVLVEQGLHFAARLADRYVVMAKGTVVAAGKTSELSAEEVRQHLTV
ncbi:MAG: ATP-binding cassette domain-containing protein [Burkholderiales bacterium]|nr:ATP-binding cassette domain-containing protein [Burkholderiales bacterium]